MTHKYKSSVQTNHYLALIGWRKLANQKLTGCNFYADSLSLLLLARFLGFRMKYLPGAKMMKALDFEKLDYLILAPFELEQFDSEKQYILEDFKENVYLTERLRAWLSEKKGSEIVFVAISSPKQNILAIQISEEFSFNIHCVGAACIEYKTSKFSLISRVTGLGLEWLARLFYNPRRFIHKLAQILNEIIHIMGSKKVRDDFVLFLRRLNEQS